MAQQIQQILSLTGAHRGHRALDKNQSYRVSYKGGDVTIMASSDGLAFDEVPNGSIISWKCAVYPIVHSIPATSHVTFTLEKIGEVEALDIILGRLKETHAAMSAAMDNFSKSL